jgi:sugar phosphate isomerase/epimerase
MRLAICNEMFGSQPIGEVFELAYRWGYAGVELAPYTLAADPLTLSSGARREIRDQARQAQVEIVGLHWLLARTSGLHLTSPDDAVRRRTTDYLSGLAVLTSDLGGSVMVLGSPAQRNLLPGVTHDQAMEYAADVIEAVAPTLRRRNVALALEPLGPEETDFLTSARMARILADRCGCPLVGVNLDVKAMSADADASEPNGGSFPQIIRDTSRHLKHFHANDPNRQGPGMGTVRYEPILGALREVGYDGWLSVEAFDLSAGIEALATRSQQYLDRVCRHVG